MNLKMALTLIPCLFSHAAMAVPAVITNLNCSGYEFGVGGVSAIYTGMDFNLTETNAFGLAFTQQAQVLRADSLTGSDVVFTLRGRITGAQYKLTVRSNGQSQISSGEGQMDVVCVGNINAAPVGGKR